MIRKWAWTGQWLAGFIGAAGLGCEIAYGADIYYVLITAGALMWGFFTKLSRLS